MKPPKNSDRIRLVPRIRIIRGRDIALGPGKADLLEAVELTGTKRTPLGSGRTAVELRVEAFNLTNTPPLGAPNGVLGAPGFGSITSAGDPRVVQVGVEIHLLNA